MLDIVGTIELIREHFAALVASVLFFALVIWVVRMNAANGPYKEFRLAHMVMRKDGTLDRKGLQQTVLFLVSIYGFIHVIQHMPDRIVEYFGAMATIWLGSHWLGTRFPSPDGAQDEHGDKSPHP